MTHFRHERYDEARQQLSVWLREGVIQSPEHRLEGIENVTGPLQIYSPARISVKPSSLCKCDFGSAVTESSDSALRLISNYSSQRVLPGDIAIGQRGAERAPGTSIGVSGRSADTVTCAIQARYRLKIFVDYASV